LQSLKVKNSSILQAFAGCVPHLRSLLANVPWADLRLNEQLLD
jgi:hypothetical protein